MSWKDAFVSMASGALNLIVFVLDYPQSVMDLWIRFLQLFKSIMAL